MLRIAHAGLVPLGAKIVDDPEARRIGRVAAASTAPVSRTPSTG